MHLMPPYRNIDHECLHEVGIYIVLFVCLDDGSHIPTFYLLQQTVQQRGAEVIKARKLSSAMSAAKAACDHMHDWFAGTQGVSCCLLSRSCTSLSN